MFKNYFKIALRNIIKHKGYSFINIVGLAIGMAFCMLIFLFVRNELSYDRYHEKASRIYRLTQESSWGGKYFHTTLIPNPLAPEFARAFPEIESVVRVNHIPNKVLIGHEDKHFKEDRFYLADPSIFHVFSFPLVRGDAETVLRNPFSVVISEDMADKYFGEHDPIGKTLSYEKTFDFTVMGILKNIPENSHFKCDFIAPFACANDLYWDGYAEDRTQSSLRTYFLLKEGSSPEALESKLPDFVDRFLAPVIAMYRPMMERMGYTEEDFMFKLNVQPLTDIHLHSHLFAELEPNYDIRYIYFYSAIAVITLLIACINFMNLATARSAGRAKEVGLRKVVGAQRVQLIKQFMGESVLISTMALLLALLLVELLLPAFSSILGKRLSLDYAHDWTALLALIGIAAFVGILSGSYPAFFISSFRPVNVLYGRMRMRSRSGLRSLLVVFQFTVSIFLIIATLLITSQMNYLRQRRLGFRKEHMVVIPLDNDDVRNQYSSLKNELVKHADILGVTGASNVISRIFSSTPVWWEGAAEGESQPIQKLYVDPDFIETFDIELIDGRDFSKSLASDERSAFILNASAVEQFGWSSAIGKQMAWKRDLNDKKTVIGVIRDFHFRSLHERIEPLILQLRGSTFRIMYVKLRAENIEESLALVENNWKVIFPDRPFEFFFLEDDIDAMYKSEQKMGQLFRYASLLAIFIACLGLFGLVSFATEQRTKEIGIRKAIGATVINIVLLLSREFLKWVAVANVIAWPIAYFIMDSWLRDFAYRARMSVWIFVLSAVLAFVIALVTVSTQTVKAALANPVKTLRYE